MQSLILFSKTEIISFSAFNLIWNSNLFLNLWNTKNYSNFIELFESKALVFLIKSFLELTKIKLVKNSLIESKRNFRKFTRKFQILIRLRKLSYAPTPIFKKKNLLNVFFFFTRIFHFYPLRHKKAIIVGVLKFRIFNFNEQPVFYVSKQSKLTVKKNKIYSKKKTLKKKKFNFNAKMVNFFFYLRALMKNKKKNKSRLNFLFFIRSRFNSKKKKYSSKPFLFLNNGDFSKNFKKIGRTSLDFFFKAERSYFSIKKNIKKKINFSKKIKNKYIYKNQKNNFNQIAKKINLFFLFGNLIDDVLHKTPKTLNVFKKITKLPFGALKSIRTRTLKRFKFKKHIFKKIKAKIKTRTSPILKRTIKNSIKKNVRYFFLLNQSATLWFSNLRKKHYFFNLEKKKNITLCWWIKKKYKFLIFFFKKYRKHLIKKTKLGSNKRTIKFLFLNKVSLVLNKPVFSLSDSTLGKKNYSNFFWKQFFLVFKIFKKKNKNGLGQNFYRNSRKTPQNKILLFSKTRTFFLGCLGNFCFIQTPATILLNDPYSFFYKKTMYSFLEKNEMQRYILKKYLKNSSFVRETRLIEMSNLYDDGIHQKFNLKFDTLPQILLNTKNQSFFKELLFTKTFEDQELNLNIRKIKFKPGYMNIWRDSRKVLNSIWNLHFRYQQKLTKYLLKYQKFVKFLHIKTEDFKLINVLLFSKIFTDYEMSLSFLKNNFVFVNGWLSTNPLFQIFKNDFIQLVISNKYYVCYKLFLNLALLKKIRLRHKTRKKVHSFYLEDDKQRGNRFSSWILSNKNLFLDIPNFLEVDYGTLSIFCLFNNAPLDVRNVYSFIDVRYGILNVYNWKYIN